MPERARPERVTATAFAPGHITVLFSPELTARDPRGRGSVGAGIVLAEGVRARATWTPGARRAIVLHTSPRRPLPISRDVARRLLGPRQGRLEIQLDHELPIGQGFGMSAAGALATGLATAKVLGQPSQLAIEVAHLADLFGGGGLGGVSAILAGGLEVRRRPGIPPWGEVRHFAWRSPIYFSVVGPPVPSPRLLRSPAFLRRVRAAARRELRSSLAAPRREASLLAAARRFEDQLGLGAPRIQRLLREIRAEGLEAGQTMFGQVVYAVPGNRRAAREFERLLGRHHFRVRQVRPGTRGAHLVRG